MANTFAYQWFSGTTQVGTNSSTYVVQLSDIGNQITCRVTATDSAGSASVTSAATSAVITSDYLDETFTGANGAVWNATRWNTSGVISPATATIQNNSGQLTTGTGAFASDANVHTVLTKTDVSAVVTMVPTLPIAEEYGIIGVRCDGNWFGNFPNTGYTIEVDFLNNLYKICKTVGGVLSTINTVTGLPSGVPLRTRIQIQGSTIKTRVWAASVAEPVTWDQTLTDTDISAAGSVALTLQNGSATNARTLQFDNFAMQVPV